MVTLSLPKQETTISADFQLSFRSPFGWIRAISNGRSLTRLDWDQKHWDDPDKPDSVSRETINQLNEYFAGGRFSFNLPIDPANKTEIARSWLNMMAKIPYGSTITYKEFASAMGKPNAARAAGNACATNPIPIIFPCHRLIKSDGSIGSYSGGSSLPHDNAGNLARKMALISLERRFS